MDERKSNRTNTATIDRTHRMTSNGIPFLGLGTWQMTDPERCARAVQSALECGYRHLDTAQVYGNEEAVGEGIERASISRSKIFLATKVWIDNLNYDGVLEAVEESRRKLGVDVIDLLYVHWPAKTYDPSETLPALDHLVDRGIICHIGVSNFESDNINRAQEHTDNTIFANQIEIHPLWPQRELVDFCQQQGIHVVGYSPLGRGEIFEVLILRELGEKYDASPAQISLAWLRSRGISAIPKASTEAHIRDNWGSLSIELSEEDIAEIDGIERQERQLDPPFAPWQ